MWSELDVDASSVLQGSSSRLKLLSAFDADYVTSRVTTDVVFQESREIVLVVRFPLCYSYDLYRLSIYLLTIVIWYVWLLLLYLFTVFFMLVVIPSCKIS
ncbi:unnamed protein product [Arabidopsis halleri]